MVDMTAPVAFRMHTTTGAELGKLTYDNRVKVQQITSDYREIPLNVYRLADHATWLMIIDRQHPNEGYRTQLIQTLTELSRKLGWLGNRAQTAIVARVLGGWDVDAGCHKTAAGITPVRSIMDIK